MCTFEYRPPYENHVRITWTVECIQSIVFYLLILRLIYITDLFLHLFNVQRTRYTQLHSGTTYHVRVRALTTAPLGDSPATYGASLYSHPAVGSTTTTPTSMGTTPSAPRSMHVQRWSSTKTSATQLKISWQEVTSAKLQVSAYLLYWRYVKSVLMVS